MLRSLRQSLYWIGLVGGGGLFLLQIKGAYQAILFSRVQISPLALGIAACFPLISTGLQMWAWMWVMRYLGANLTWVEVMQGYSVSFLPRYIPGSVWGYLSRNEWLLRSHGVSHGNSNLGSFIEVVLIIFSGGVVALVSGVVLVLGWAGISVGLGLGAVIIGVGWAFLTVWRSAGCQWIRIRWLARFSVQKPIRAQEYLLGILIYSSIWLCHGWLIWCVAWSLGGDQSYLAFLILFYVSWLAGFLVIFVPSGFGVREALLISLMTTQMGYNMDQAVAISVLTRLIILMDEAIWVMVGLTIYWKGRVNL